MSSLNTRYTFYMFITNSHMIQSRRNYNNHVFLLKSQRIGLLGLHTLENKELTTHSFYPLIHRFRSLYYHEWEFSPCGLTTLGPASTNLQHFLWDALWKKNVLKSLFFFFTSNQILPFIPFLKTSYHQRDQREREKELWWKILILNSFYSNFCGNIQDKTHHAKMKW